MPSSRDAHSVLQRSLVIFGIALMGVGFIGIRAVDASIPRTAALDPTRSASASKTEGLDNEVITVNWSGFGPTGQDGSNQTVVLQCIANPQTLADCFTANPYPAIANGNRKLGRTLDDGTGSVQFEVRPAAQLPVLNCSESNPCSVLIYESGESSIPADELPQTAAIVELEFAPSVADCPPVTDFDLRFDGSASASTLFYRWAAEKCDGRNAIVIDYTTGGDNTGRENFLGGLVDGGVTGLAASKYELESHSEVEDFEYAPVDLTAVAVVVNMRDPMTGEPITDLTLSPRLVARLITDSDVTNLFTDPEFRRLNSRVRLPLNGLEYPVLRAEKNADSYIVTSWLVSDENTSLFLADEDVYNKPVNDAYIGLEYPRDIFENVAQSANFLPRQGQVNVALKMFYGISPSGTTPLNPTEIGLIGIVDFPTAQRFGLPTAKLVNAAGVAVAPTEESILAGYESMQSLRNGTKVNDFSSTNEAAYPLVKVDYMMVPTKGIDNEKNESLQSFLKFAVGAGQDILLPGYVELPDDLKSQTLQVIETLKDNLIPESTTSTTTSTTSTTVYVPDTTDYGSYDTTTTTSTPVTTTTTSTPTVIVGRPALETLPRGQSLQTVPFIFIGGLMSSIGAFWGRIRKGVKKMNPKRWRWFAGTVGVLIVGFMLNVFVLSDISHDRAQRLLYAEFRSALKNGAAPVDSPVAKGTPVAIIKIPSIDVDEVVVEGTSSRDLQRGVGHLRSSALPGQYGTSVLIGRRTSFGGVFGEIGSLEPGDEIQVVSAQGTTTYRVASKDIFGGEDAEAFAPAGNALRLVTSASTFGTSKRLSVLALAEKGTTFPVGLKSVISPVSLDELGANMNHQNAGSLLVWLQIMIVATAGAIWVVNRWGLRSAWPMVSPVMLVMLYVVSNQLIGILPSYF